MKKILFVCLLLGICFYISFSLEKKPNPAFAPDTSHIEIISDDNKTKIGKEVLNENAPVISDEECIFPSDIKDSGTLVVDIPIPENPFFSSVASNLCLPGDPIQEIVACNGVVPEIIIPNGAVGVFSKGDSEGWLCAAGSTILWSFEKYPMKNGTTQTLGVGYIKDGVMYEMQTYRDSLEGEYDLIVPQDGTYHIYVMGLSSDPISLKESNIQIN